MRQITKLMIRDYNLKKLNYDFMGFKFNRTSELSFHHLVIPHRECKGIENDGYVKWNGAILVQATSHEYLHTIEIYDRASFEQITDLMIQMNNNGTLDEERLFEIEKILRGFESKYSGFTNRKGNKLIKDRYYKRIYK